ncbi:hypothetical protein Pcac1_g29422 [Phytophthora cactorum]|nr:hypothetical protein Pcac1_g29422 [Phytophthora cactorum]
MKELVFCAVPKVFDLDGDFDCLELVKAIYGLKQASRVWNETFDEFVCSIGFKCRRSPVPLRQKSLTVTACSCWSTWMTC